MTEEQWPEEPSERVAVLLERVLDELDLDQPWPAGADGPRGRTSGNNRVVLPDGWLKDPYDCAGVGEDAELDTSGG